MSKEKEVKKTKKKTEEKVIENETNKTIITNRKWFFLGVGLLVITLLSCFLINYAFKNGGNLDLSKLATKAATSSAKYYTNATKAQSKIFDLYDFTSYKNKGGKLNVTAGGKTVDAIGEGQSVTKGWIFKGSTNKNGSSSTYVYCIELGNKYNKSLSDTDQSATYYNNLGEFAKKSIDLVTIYGFPNKKYKVSGSDSDYIKSVRYMATQTLIWEFQQGWRKNYDKTKMPTGTGKKIYDRTIAKNDDLKHVYNATLDAIAKSQKMPSFSSKTTDAKAKTLNYNSYTKTGGKYVLKLTDSNNVLSGTTLSCPNGITCKVDNKTLTITSTKALTKNTKITFTKTIKGNDNGMVFIDGGKTSDGQRMGTGVAASFKIKSYLYVNTEDLGSITIKKTSEDKIVKGFKFSVTGKFDGKNNTTKEVTTNDKGIATITNLKLGYTFVVKEKLSTEQSKKYIAVASQSKKVSSDNKTVTFKFTNELQDKSGIYIKKVSTENSNEYIKGAVLELQRLDGKKWVVVKTITTDGQKIKLTKEVQYGKTYKVCEKSAPAGYIKSGCSASQKIDDKNKTYSFVLKNKPTTVTIKKIDKISKKALAGAKLRIIDADSKKVVVSDWKTSTSPKEIKGVLVVGKKYTIQEISSPAGYVIASNYTFTFKDNATIVFEDTPIKITVSKKGENNKLIKGAVLHLEDSSGVQIGDKWTSQENKEFTISGASNDKIVVGGKYRVCEDTAPVGYVKAGCSKYQTIKSNKSDYSFELTNKKTEVVISKKSAVNSPEVCGAKIQIIDNNGNVVESWTSCQNKEKEHKVYGLKYGAKYTLKEILAPEGYAISKSEQKFTVGASTSVTMYNEPTKVTVYKKDKNTNGLLSGAKLLLIEKQTQKVVKDGEWTSSGEPKVFMGLKTNTDYIIREVEAPNGYVKSEDIEFKLAVTQSSKEITVYNTPIVPVPNTAANNSPATIIIGIVLMVGGIGAAVLIRKGVIQN